MRPLLALVVVLLAAGCSSHRKGGIIGHRGLPTTDPISVMPLADAMSHRAPVPGTGQAMTAAVVAGLRARGYTVTVGEAADAKLVLTGSVTEWEPDLGVALRLSDAATHETVSWVDCAKGGMEIGSSDRHALVPDVAAIALRTLLAPADEYHLLGF